MSPLRRGSEEERDQYGAWDISLQCESHRIDSPDVAPPVLPLVSRRGWPLQVVGAPLSAPLMD